MIDCQSWAHAQSESEKEVRASVARVPSGSMLSRETQAERGSSLGIYEHALGGGPVRWCWIRHESGQEGDRERNVGPGANGEVQE